MRLLLDTHVFLWLFEAPERIAPQALARIEHPETAVDVSAVTGFEIATKVAIGKLRLPAAPPEYLRSRCRRVGFTIVPLTMEQATAVGALPLHHRDPFDRLLIAQASIEGYTLVSADAIFAKYDLHVLSAA